MDRPYSASLASSSFTPWGHLAKRFLVSATRHRVGGINPLPEYEWEFTDNQRCLGSGWRRCGGLRVERRAEQRGGEHGVWIVHGLVVPFVLSVSVTCTSVCSWVVAVIWSSVDAALAAATLPGLFGQAGVEGVRIRQEFQAEIGPLVGGETPEATGIGSPL